MVTIEDARAAAGRALADRDRFAVRLTAARRERDAAARDRFENGQARRRARELAEEIDRLEEKVRDAEVVVADRDAALQRAEAAGRAHAKEF